MTLPLALAAALLVALSLRLPSMISTALAAYLALVTEIALVTWGLSPFHALTARGLLWTEVALLAAALGLWWRRGRPGLELAPARAALGVVAREPLTALYVAIAAAALSYELLLALGVPPTNWDSLTYHLARVAAWRQHHGISWIQNAPTARMNEFQPLAEQEILFLVVATGTTAVYALPQFVAELAILVAVYGASRRLGFGVGAAVCSAALLASFSLIALEATTAQNDLVSASFPIVAACLLLGPSQTEAVLAGVAAGLGIGAKLTTVLVLPVLLWLAWSGGSRRLRLALGGGVLGLLGGGLWGFVLNLAHTGSPLGHGQGRTENTVSPSLTGTLGTVAHLLDRLVDASVVPYWAVGAFALAGACAVGAAVSARGGERRRWAMLAVAVPLLAPALVLGLSHIPVGDPPWIEHQANEDYSGFGPVGTFALIAAPVATLVAVRGRDSRQLALALALPAYIVLLAIYAKYNIWITRFLIVPAALSAPLFGRLFPNRLMSGAILAVASLGVGLTLTHDATKPLGGALGRPWTLDQVQALAEGPAEPTGKRLAAALVAYQRLVPARSCVGAVLDPDEPSYLLWGPSLRHRVVFLSSLAAVQEAYTNGLGYVVVSTGANAPVSKLFANAGWSLEPLASYWTLAVAPHTARGATCA